MVERRRGRSQKDDENNAATNSSVSVFSGVGNVNRLEGGDTESIAGKHIDNSDNADGRDDAVNVDRRTNHDARRRQWNIADNLCGHSSGVAEKHRDNLSVLTSRHDKLFQRGIFRSNCSCNDSVCNLR